MMSRHLREEMEVAGATNDETNEVGTTKAMDWFIQQHSSRNRNAIVEETAMVKYSTFS